MRIVSCSRPVIGSESQTPWGIEGGTLEHCV